MAKSTNARVTQKIDTATNWSAAQNFTPLKGEFILYSDDEGATQKIKVGDGNTKVNDLDFYLEEAASEKEIDNLFND